jgi:dienelactone hydrolase
VYNFLGAEDKLAIDLRQGLHPPSARDMENYLDFIDFVFERGSIKPENKLYYDYSFSKWLGLSNEMIDPQEYPQKGINDLLIDSHGKSINNSSEWMEKIPDIKARINWILGEEPPSVAPGDQPDYMKEVVGYPDLDPQIKSIPVMFGRLYFPTDDSGKPNNQKIPVVIYLHEYDYANGYAKAGSEIFSKSGDIISQFTEKGCAVYLFDQIGFGTRIKEGTFFYERFPHWSKLGRMVADVRWVVDAISEIEFVDSGKIYAAGYALGGTVGLFSAALDERIAGVVSVSGFSPMRTNIPGKTAEGIYGYSHLHGLLPRLGFFAGEEARIPVDFHEIIACIAPRPVFIITPTWDQFASFPDVQQCINEVGNVYNLFSQKENVSLFAPEDYNRFSVEMRKEMTDWINMYLPATNQ